MKGVFGDVHLVGEMPTCRGPMKRVSRSSGCCRRVRCGGVGSIAGGKTGTNVWRCRDHLYPFGFVQRPQPRAQTLNGASFPNSRRIPRDIVSSRHAHEGVCPSPA
jgi:hypothetical protein